MKRPISSASLAFLALAVSGADASAQPSSAEEEAVLAPIQRLFDGMRAGDGDMVRSAFAEGAVLIQTENREGEPATSVSPIDRFVQTVASGGGGWDEPFWDPVIQVQDHLATVWTKYAFYADEAFSHCGVDAFILARGADGWKIAALADTRERENCELPPDRDRGR